jgi:alpha-galactosidase
MQIACLALAKAVAALASMSGQGAAASGLEIRFHGDSSRFSLLWAGDPPGEWANLTPSVRIDGRWIDGNELSKAQWTVSSGGSEAEWIAQGQLPLRSLRVGIKKSDRGPYAIVRLSAEVAYDCRLGGFRLTSADEAKRGPAISGPAGEWFLFGEDFNALRIGQIHRLDAMTTSIQGCWLSSLQNPKRNETYVFAALSAELWPTWMEWSAPAASAPGPSLAIRAGGRTGAEQIDVKAGSEIHSDRFLIGFWEGMTPQQALIEAADVMADSLNRQRPPRRPAPGWCSWMYHAGKVTEDDVLRAADAMAERLKPHGYRTVQIDGGWWTNRGEWKPNERFPHGMRWLADQIHDRGLEFGLHMSPFRLDADSRFVAERPDWIIRSLETGEPLTESGRGRHCILDGSHPEARAWLHGLFRNMAREWTVDYFKLDFLMHGAEEGARWDSSMTGLQAYVAAMKAVRDAIPPHVTVLGCNQPALAALDCFDSSRVGVDINKVGLGHVGPSGEFANMKWGPAEGRNLDWPSSANQSLTAQARAVSRHFYAHGRFFISDADAVLATPDYSLDEARAHMTLAALTGGGLFLGDRLDTLPPERLDIIANPDVLEIWRAGRHAVPLDLFDAEPVPRVWRLDISDRVIIAVFNWSDREDQRAWPWAAFGMEKGQTWQVRDIWKGKPIATESNTIHLEQPGHSVTLLEFLHAPRSEGRMMDPKPSDESGAAHLGLGTD